MASEMEGALFRTLRAVMASDVVYENKRSVEIVLERETYEAAQRLVASIESTTPKPDPTLPPITGSGHIAIKRGT